MVDTQSDSSQIGYGQQTPSVATSDFNAVSFLVRQMIARLDTMKLVQVMKVTPGEGSGDIKKAGTVDVQPLVSQIDGNGNGVPHGIVHGIPWTRVQGGKNAVVVDPEVGDIGYVVVSDRDISTVKKTGKKGAPGSLRQYSISDGVYAGGALNVAPEQYLVFTAAGCRLVTKDGGSITLSKDDGITVKPAAGKPIILDGNVIVKGNLQLQGLIQAVDGTLYSGAIHTGGDVVAGSGTGDQVGLQSHTHKYNRPTGASTIAETVAPTAGT